MAETYDLRKAQHRCVKCGDPLPAQYAYVSCVPCLDWDSAQHRLRYAARPRPVPPQRPVPRLHRKALTHWWTVGHDPHPVEE